MNFKHIFSTRLDRVLLPHWDTPKNLSELVFSFEEECERIEILNRFLYVYSRHRADFWTAILVLKHTWAKDAAFFKNWLHNGLNHDAKNALLAILIEWMIKPILLTLLLILFFNA